MAATSREEVFNVSAEKFYNAIVDYPNYPKILGEVDSLDIIENDESHAKVQYNIHIVKKISYILNMTHQRPSEVSWELDSGSIFKKNTGCWSIEALDDNSCRVTYSLDVALKVFAPKAITNKLVAVSLPKMMESFYKHAKTLS